MLAAHTCVPPVVGASHAPALNGLALADATDITIDTGFRVSRDGFSFANWAGLDTKDAMSGKHMVQLLSKAGQCTTNIVEPYCILRGGTVVTLAHINEHLAGGRCEGMAILAARLFRRSTKLVHLSKTAGTTAALTRVEAADEIAYWWATQLAPNVQRYSVSKRTVRPGDLATEMTKRMRNKVLLTIGLYSGDIAHTVLPVKARIVSGRTYFTVYDPNFPGTTRTLVINRYNDTWSYDRMLTSAGTLVNLRGKGAGGLDYVPVSVRSHLSQWENLRGF